MQSLLLQGKVSILLATDVVARGIHIKRLRYVVNYDFPSTIEQYCHRYIQLHCTNHLTG